MLSNLIPFLAAEAAYRGERARREIAGSARSRPLFPDRRSWLRRAF